MFPYSAEVSGQLAGGMALLATSDLFTDSQRRTLTVFCDTIVPSLEPPDGDADATGFWARAASHQGVPEAVEVALLQSPPPAEQVDGLRQLLDALADSGLTPEAPQAAREAIVLGVEDSGPEALAGINALRGLARPCTTRCRTWAPAATRTGTCSATRGRSACPPTSRSRWRSAARRPSTT